MPGRGEAVLHAALTLLLAGNSFDDRRAMVAVDFARLVGWPAIPLQHFPYEGQQLFFAVTRTPHGKLAVHDFPSDQSRAHLGAHGMSGNNKWDARFVPAAGAKPLRTFTSATAAIKFMSGQGRAFPARVRTVGMSDLFDTRYDRSRSNKKRVAATAIQSAFRGRQARKAVYGPPTRNNPRGGVAYQAALRRFNEEAAGA